MLARERHRSPKNLHSLWTEHYVWENLWTSARHDLWWTMRSGFGRQRLPATRTVFSYNHHPRRSAAQSEVEVSDSSFHHIDWFIVRSPNPGCAPFWRPIELLVFQWEALRSLYERWAQKTNGWFKFKQGFGKCFIENTLININWWF